MQRADFTESSTESSLESKLKRLAAIAYQVRLINGQVSSQMFANNYQGLNPYQPMVDKLVTEWNQMLDELGVVATLDEFIAESDDCTLDEMEQLLCEHFFLSKSAEIGEEMLWNHDRMKDWPHYDGYGTCIPNYDRVLKFNDKELDAKLASLTLSPQAVMELKRLLQGQHEGLPAIRAAAHYLHEQTIENLDTKLKQGKEKLKKKKDELDSEKKSIDKKIQTKSDTIAKYETEIQSKKDSIQTELKNFKEAAAELNLDVTTEKKTESAVQEVTKKLTTAKAELAEYEALKDKKNKGSLTKEEKKRKEELSRRKKDNEKDCEAYEKLINPYKKIKGLERVKKAVEDNLEKTNKDKDSLTEQRSTLDEELNDLEEQGKKLEDEIVTRAAAADEAYESKMDYESVVAVCAGQEKVVNELSSELLTIIDFFSRLTSLKTDKHIEVVGTVKTIVLSFPEVFKIYNKISTMISVSAPQFAKAVNTSKDIAILLEKLGGPLGVINQFVNPVLGIISATTKIIGFISERLGYDLFPDPVLQAIKQLAKQMESGFAEVKQKLDETRAVLAVHTKMLQDALDLGKLTLAEVNQLGKLTRKHIKESDLQKADDVRKSQRDRALDDHKQVVSQAIPLLSKTSTTVQFIEYVKLLNLSVQQAVNGGDTKVVNISDMIPDVYSAINYLAGQIHLKKYGISAVQYPNYPLLSGVIQIAIVELPAVILNFASRKSTVELDMIVGVASAFTETLLTKTKSLDSLLDELRKNPAWAGDIYKLIHGKITELSALIDEDLEGTQSTAGAMDKRKKVYFQRKFADWQERFLSKKKPEDMFYARKRLGMLSDRKYSKQKKQYSTVLENHLQSVLENLQQIISLEVSNIDACFEHDEQDAYIIFPQDLTLIPLFFSRKKIDDLLQTHPDLQRLRFLEKLGIGSIAIEYLLTPVSLTTPDDDRTHLHYELTLRFGCVTTDDAQLPDAYTDFVVGRFPYEAVHSFGVVKNDRVWYIDPDHTKSIVKEDDVDKFLSARTLFRNRIIVFKVKMKNGQIWIGASLLLKDKGIFSDYYYNETIFSPDDEVYNDLRAFIEKTATDLSEVEERLKAKLPRLLGYDQQYELNLNEFLISVMYGTDPRFARLQGLPDRSAFDLLSGDGIADGEARIKHRSAVCDFPGLFRILSAPTIHSYLHQHLLYDAEQSRAIYDMVDDPASPLPESVASCFYEEPIVETADKRHELDRKLTRKIAEIIKSETKGRYEELLQEIFKKYEVLIGLFELLTGVDYSTIAHLIAQFLGIPHPQHLRDLIAEDPEGFVNLIYQLAEQPVDLQKAAELHARMMEFENPMRYQLAQDIAALKPLSSAHSLRDEVTRLQSLTPGEQVKFLSRSNLFIADDQSTREASVTPEKVATSTDVPSGTKSSPAEAGLFSTTNPMAANKDGVIAISGAGFQCGPLSLAFAARTASRLHPDYRHAIPQFILSLRYDMVKPTSDSAKIIEREALGKKIRSDYLGPALLASETYQNGWVDSFIDVCMHEIGYPSVRMESLEASIKSNKEFFASLVPSKEMILKHMTSHQYDEVHLDEDEFARFNRTFHELFITPTKPVAQSEIDAFFNSYATAEKITQFCYLFKRSYDLVDRSEISGEMLSKIKENHCRPFIFTTMSTCLEKIDLRKNNDLVLLGEFANAFLACGFLAKEENHQHVMRFYCEHLLSNPAIKKECFKRYVDYVCNETVMTTGDELGCLAHAWKLALTVITADRTFQLGFQEHSAEMHLSVTLSNMSGTHWDVKATAKTPINQEWSYQERKTI